MACTHRRRGQDSFVWSPIVLTLPTRQFCFIIVYTKASGRIHQPYHRQWLCAQYRFLHVGLCNLNVGESIYHLDVYFQYGKPIAMLQVTQSPYPPLVVTFYQKNDIKGTQSKTRGSAIAEEPRDALRQLKYYGRFFDWAIDKKLC